jgi:sec-independent protein translocase protein TatB
MFNVTGGELVIIFLVALVILGPERLPKAAREIGKVMGQIRDVSSNFQQELKDAFHEHDEPLASPARPQLTALKGGARSEPPAEPGWSNPSTPARDASGTPAVAATGDAIAAAAPPSALRAVGAAIDPGPSDGAADPADGGTPAPHHEDGPPRDDAGPTTG